MNNKVPSNNTNTALKATEEEKSMADIPNEINIGKKENKRNDEKENIDALSEKSLVKNPILGGIAVSASNPYWWVWWATIGFAFMIKYNISFSSWNILFFFIGHELGDLIWYLFISIMVHFGKNYINKRIYYAILGACAIFMVGFGIYLLQSLF